MAKWGEGDPRWLVQEREDGVNVNGWHWEEKDRMAWARERIASMLEGLTANAAPLHAELRVNKVSKIDGEASVSMRKGGKKLAVFDLHLHLEWAGQMRKEGAEEVTGTLKITEFSNHGDEEDLIVECTKNGTSSDGEALCKAAKAQLIPSIWRALEPLAEEMLATL